MTAGTLIGHDQLGLGASKAHDRTDRRNPP